MSIESMFYPEGVSFTREDKKDYLRQNLIFNTTEEILLVLENLGISRRDLAGRLKKSPAHVSQVLSGTRNLTLGTLSDICYELGCEPTIKVTSTRWETMAQPEFGQAKAPGEKVTETIYFQEFAFKSDLTVRQ
tara:strand:- start:625 stop:1023 length:399 start_codon:yes stop_codon:yes gene_type:complete